MRVNQAELAKALGLTKGRISQLVKAGILIPGNDGKFDLKTAIAQYMAHQGEGHSSPRADSTQLNELVALKLENAKAKLEIQQAAVELQRLKAQIARGELVNQQAAKLLLSRIVWELRNQIWNLPLKFIHKLTAEHGQQVELDQQIFREFEAAFSVVNQKDIAGENAYILAKADIQVELCQAEIVILEHENRDPETVKSCLDFAKEIRSLFIEMKPELIEKLGLKLHIREKGQQSKTEFVKSEACQ